MVQIKLFIALILAAAAIAPAIALPVPGGGSSSKPDGSKKGYKQLSDTASTSTLPPPNTPEKNKPV